MDEPVHFKTEGYMGTRGPVQLWLQLLGVQIETDLSAHPGASPVLPRMVGNKVELANGMLN